MTDGPYQNYLAEFMRESGLNDPKLADRLEISKQQVFNLRRGHRKLTVEWAKRIAPHLGVSWQELITGSPDPWRKQARIDLLAAFDAMNDERRRALLATAKELMPTPLQGGAPESPAAARPQPRGGAPPPRPTLGGRVHENPVRAECAGNVVHLVGAAE